MSISLTVFCTCVHTGGTILARYEAPADEFLFPDGPLGSLRTLALSKSRKYKVRASSDIHRHTHTHTHTHTLILTYSLTLTHTHTHRSTLHMSLSQLPHPSRKSQFTHLPPHHPQNHHPTQRNLLFQKPSLVRKWAGPHKTSSAYYSTATRSHTHKTRGEKRGDTMQKLDSSPLSEKPHQKQRSRGLQLGVEILKYKDPSLRTLQIYITAALPLLAPTTGPRALEEASEDTVCPPGGKNRLTYAQNLPPAST